MKTLKFFFLLIISSTFLYSQNLDEIINKTNEALGYNHYKNVKTTLSEITMSMMGMDIKMKLYKEEPSKARVEMNVMGQNIISVVTDEYGWMAQNGMIQDIPQDQLEEFKTKVKSQTSLFDFIMDEISDKSKGNIKLEGKEKVDGKDNFKISKIDEEGKISYIYIDAKTYLITKISGKQEVMGSGEQDVEILFKKYKDYEGFKIPTLFEMTADGETFGEITIDKYEFNKPIDPELFKKP